MKYPLWSIAPIKVSEIQKILRKPNSSKQKAIIPANYIKNKVNSQDNNWTTTRSTKPQFPIENVNSKGNPSGNGNGKHDI